jgi:hypothetical protein
MELVACAAVVDVDNAGTVAVLPEQAVSARARR